MADKAKNIRITSTTPPIDISITGIAYDSRRVEEGFLFVAIRGYKTDGHRYISQAIERGAACVIIANNVDKAVLIKQYPNVLFITSENTRAALAEVSAVFYENPSSEIEMLGVTGTNGKTTTTFLLKKIIEAGGRKTGLIGTVVNVIGGREIKTKHTTPESLELQVLFRTMRNEEAEAAVMEVSSHALSLSRVDTLAFDSIIFTNITEDHLDFHKDMNEYLEAKLRLFDILAESPKPKKTAFVNIHSDYFSRIEERARRHGLTMKTFGFDNTAHFYAKDIRLAINGIEYAFYAEGEKKADVRLSLAGRFNVLNTLGALAYAYEYGYDIHAAAEALFDVQVPGRFEIISGKDVPFTVAVDYAHTPDALENVLDAARGLQPNKLIVVFGCGGDRDRQKRPLMAQAAGERADYAILTTDNPRTEDISQILNDAKAGLINTAAEHIVITERREAIEHAIKKAEAGDIVIIAGKGHEDYQVFRDKSIHFDDREVAREIVSKHLR